MSRQFTKLDLISHDFRNDPWGMFGKLRKQGSVIKIKIPFLGKSWAATTYESVNGLLKDSELFVRDSKNAGRKNIVPFQWIMPRVFFSLIHNMLAADGEKHRRLRSLVDQAFARRNVEEMESRIQLLANEQLSQMEKAAKYNIVDFQEHFARPFPLTVICELLGLPLEDRPKFHEWFKPFSTVKSIFGIFTLGKGMSKITRYLKAQVTLAKRHPREGLISELVEAESEGHKLDEQELLSMIFLLLVAGHETTVHLINNAVHALLSFPEQKQQLLSDWSLSSAVIEEVLRYCSPLQMSKPRYVSRDVEYFGQPLKRGESIVALLAAANYDPERFNNPHQFDIHRERNYHMTFGSGPHVCLGMKLARTEAHIAIKGLFERWPNLEAAFDLSKPDWSSRIGTRGFNTLQVRLG